MILPTQKELEAMQKIEGGADVFDPLLAQTLREIEKKQDKGTYPRFVILTRPMGNYAPDEPLPKLGGTLTQNGRRVIEYMTRLLSGEKERT